MGLFVPPQVARELVERRREYEARVMAMTLKDELDHWNRELRRIDPRLQLVKAMDDLPPGTALRPGFYHVIRQNPGAPPTIMVIEGPGGEFCEPNSRIFDMLRERDLQNPVVGHERRRRKRELEEAQARARDRENRAMDEETLERWLAASRTQVSLADVPWSQAMAGRRGRRR